jgi:hypothetical protein
VMPASLVAVQHAVPRTQLGVATASTAFFRTLGGAIGVAVLSSVLLGAMHHGRPMDGSAPVVDGAASTRGDTPSFLASVTPEEADAAFRRVLLLAAAISSLAFVFTLRVPDRHLGGGTT